MSKYCEECDDPIKQKKTKCRTCQGIGRVHTDVCEECRGKKKLIQSICENCYKREEERSRNATLNRAWDYE